MKNVVFTMVCLMALLPAAVHAEIIGWWTTEEAGTFDRHVLTVAPTEGETMNGFDIMVRDPLYQGLFVTGNPPIFKEGKDADTSFLLNKTHGVPPNVVTDLVTVSEYEDTNHLMAGLAWAAGGAYQGGWSAALQLLEILVPKGSIKSPFSGLQVLDTLAQTAAMVDTNQGKRFLNIIPEPSSLALLLAGLVGLACYAWRHRR